MAAVHLRVAVTGELGPPPVRDGVAELGVGVVGEELERGARPPLLAHEQERAVRGQQDEGRLGGQATTVEGR